MTSAYFALRQIAGGTRHDAPFQWGELQNIWQNDALANKLADEFPTEDSTSGNATAGIFIDARSSLWARSASTSQRR